MLKLKILSALCGLLCLASTGGNADNNCKLINRKCIPCTTDIPPLKGDLLTEYHIELGNGWCVVDEHHLEKDYFFPDFCEALDFTNQIGALAEEEGHHPDILLSYGKVTILLWTHKIDGLSESDFILAAKCDQIHND